MSMNKTAYLSVLVEPRFKAKLIEIAKREDASLGFIVRRALRKAFVELQEPEGS